MSVLGTLDVLVQLVGGEKVLAQLQELRASATGVSEKPIVFNVDSTSLERATAATERNNAAILKNTEGVNAWINERNAKLRAAAAVEDEVSARWQTNMTAWENSGQGVISVLSRLLESVTTMGDGLNTGTQFINKYANAWGIVNEQVERNIALTQEQREAAATALYNQTFRPQNPIFAQMAGQGGPMGIEQGTPMPGGGIYGVTSAADLNSPEVMAALGLGGAGGIAGDVKNISGKANLFQQLREVRIEFFAFTAAASLAFNAIDAGAQKAAGSSKQLTDVLEAGRLAENAIMAGMIGLTSANPVVGLITGGTALAGGVVGAILNQVGVAKQAAADAATAMAKPFADLRKEMEAIIPVEDKVLAGLKDIGGVNKADAANIEAAAKGDPRIGQLALTLIDQQARLKALKEGSPANMTPEQFAFQPIVGPIKTYQMAISDAAVANRELEISIGRSLYALTMQAAQFNKNTINAQQYAPLGFGSPQALGSGAPSSPAAIFSGELIQGQRIVDEYKSHLIDLASAIAQLGSIFGLTKEQLAGFTNAVYGATPILTTASDSVTSAGVFKQLKILDDQKTTDAANHLVTSINKAGDAAQAFADKVNSAIKSIIDKATGDTNITPEENKRADIQKQIAKLQGEDVEGRPNKARENASKIAQLQGELGGLGPDQPRPDEFARRLDAVGTGTPPETYGPDFMAQLALAQSRFPGASPTQLAEAFRNKSLFSMGKWTSQQVSQMYGGDAVKNSIITQMQSGIGAQVVQNAFLGSLGGMLPPGLLGQWEGTLGAGQGNVPITAGAMGAGGAAMGMSGLAGGTGADANKVQLGIKFIDGADAKLKDFYDTLVKIKSTYGNLIANISLKMADDFMKVRADILKALEAFGDITIHVGMQQGGGGGAGGSNNPPPPPDKTNVGGNLWAAGGYTGNGWIHTGEVGYEYVIPHNVLRMMERMLGGRITAPGDLLSFGAMGYSGGGGGGRGDIHLHQPIFQVPNMATMDTLGRDIRARAARGG